MLNCIDTGLFYLINNRCANPVFDLAMPLATGLGSSEFVVVVGIVLLLMRAKRMKTAGLVLLASLTISYYVVTFLKEWIARPRPFIALPDVRQLMEAGGYAFPSGHATMAFMAAVILSKYFNRAGLFFTLAAVVCFSRVYLGVHWVSDTVSGAALGSLLGYALVRVTSKYH